MSFPSSFRNEEIGNDIDKTRWRLLAKTRSAPKCSTAGTMISHIAGILVRKNFESFPGSLRIKATKRV